MAEALAYKKPPIVERIIGVYHKIPQQQFETLLPAWIERISPSFPLPGHLAEWLVDIEEKNGVPIIRSLVPRARIIHLFWKKHPKNKHVLGMRLRPDRLVFHLCREDENPHSFQELLPEMVKWLPIWAEHFGVTNLTGVSVEYVNILDGNITPQFVDSAGGLKISDALTMFANFPGSPKAFTAPLDTKVRIVIDEKKPILFDVRIRLDDRSANAIRIDFNARVFPAAKPLTFSEALHELEAGHQVMLQQFACFFTEKAKVSFAE